MDNMIEFLKEYGVYIALPVVVAGITQSLKISFKKFFKQNHIGMRLTPFIPFILGLFGGLLLPEETVATKLLNGGALGTVSIFIYKIVTTTLAKKIKLVGKIEQDSNIENE